MVTFTNPAAFLLLLLIPIWCFLRRIGWLRAPALTITLCDWDSEKIITVTAWRRIVHTVSNVLLLLCYVCVVIAASCPVTQSPKKVYTSMNGALMFVVDTSPSMASRDMVRYAAIDDSGYGESLPARRPPVVDSISRLDAAKNAIRTLADKTAGCYLGLTAMASEAAVVVPPTADRNTFLARLDLLAPGYMGDGTALGTALATAACHMASITSERKCCVLVTDGENNAGFVSGQTAAEFAAAQGISLFVLGVGKNGTAPLDYTDPQTGKSYSGTFQSHFDSAQLVAVAEAGGGQYFDIQSADDLSRVLTQVLRGAALKSSYFLRTEITDHSSMPLMLSLWIAIAAWFLKRLILKESM